MSHDDKNHSVEPAAKLQPPSREEAAPRFSGLESFCADDLLTNLLDSIPEMIYIKDVECRYRLDNLAHRIPLGVKTVEEVIGKTAFDFFPEPLALEFDTDDRRVIAAGKSLSKTTERVVDKEGSVHWVATFKSPLRGPEGEIIGLIGVGRDVTEQKIAEEELEKERTLLNALMNTIPDYIYFKDTSSRFIRVNQALADRIGLISPGEIEGKTDFDLFTEEHAQEAFEDEKQMMEKNQPIIGKEERETWKNGQVTWSSTSKLPMYNSRSELTGSFGLSRNITQQKEDQIRLAEFARKTEEMNIRVEEDLALAAELQRSFLPNEFPTFPESANTHESGLRFAHYYHPSGPVGGDFFSVRPLSDTAASIFLCDVMGHGVRSALVTAIMRTLITDLQPVASDPGLMLTQMNSRLQRILRLEWDAIFVTAVAMVVNIGTGHVHYANAGHPAPLLSRLSTNKITKLPEPDEGPGPALGLEKGVEYWASMEKVLPGDRLLLFTDGLSDICDASGRHFGEEGVREAAATQIDQPPEQVFQHLLRTIRKVTGREKPDDDVCMLAVDVKRLEYSEKEDAN
jgi:sigma-B regulation protein RsbU (phosphoserine phosphatase)